MTEHSHDNGTNLQGRNLLITIFLNLAITIAQVIGGLIAGSMALISDAVHNFSDVLSLVISYAAARISGRRQTLMQTYGYKRAGIFAAFINTATLLVIGGILIWEAVARLIDPQPIEGTIVIILAALGILLNGFSVLLIRKDAGENINMKSAYLHMFTDMLTSVAVLISGLGIRYLEWYWLDGALTIAISFYLIYTSWGLFYQSVRIFMQFTPLMINIEEIAEKIAAIEGVKNIHHVHVWQLDDKQLMMEGHIDLERDYKISEFEAILDRVEAVLEKYNISHFNIQPELEREDQKELISTGRH